MGFKSFAFEGVSLGLDPTGFNGSVGGGCAGVKVFVTVAEEDSCSALVGGASHLEKDWVKVKAKEKALLCLKVKEVKVKVKERAKAIGDVSNC